VTERNDCFDKDRTPTTCYRVVAAVAPETLRVPVHTVERGCEAIDLRATIVWP
jgi:hypothetical protein